MNFGMRVGPLVMADIVGIDLGIQAIKKRGQYDPRKVVSHALIEAGRLGQKSNAGYVTFPPGVWTSAADRSYVGYVVHWSANQLLRCSG
jgi:3-hydroxyacyl-CoA dehydrogenase